MESNCRNKKSYSENNMLLEDDGIFIAQLNL